MKKAIKWLLSVEFLFGLYIYSGYFKGNLPFVTIDITLILMVITMLMVIYRLKKTEFRIKKVYLLPIMLFLIIQFLMLLSMLYTPSIVDGLEKTLRFITITTWCFLGSFFIMKDYESLKKFLLAVLLITLIMSLSIFVSTPLQGGFIGAFGSERYIPLARASSIAMLILIGFYFTSNYNLLIRLAALFLGLLLFIPLIQSGARLSVLVTIVVVIIIPVFLIKYNSYEFIIHKRIKNFVPLIGLTIIILYILITKGFAEVLTKRLKILNNQFNQNSNVAGRSDRLSEAIEMIKESYFLGKGVDSFSYNYSGIRLDTPHNIYIEYFAELGMLAFLSFIIIVILSFYNGIKGYINSDFNYLLFIIIIMGVYWFISSLGSSGINGDRIFYAILSIMYIIPYIQANDKVYKEKKNNENLSY